MLTIKKVVHVTQNIKTNKTTEKELKGKELQEWLISHVYPTDRPKEEDSNDNPEDKVEHNTRN